MASPTSGLNGDRRHPVRDSAGVARSCPMRSRSGCPGETSITRSLPRPNRSVSLNATVTGHGINGGFDAMADEDGVRAFGGATRWAHANVVAHATDSDADSRIRRGWYDRVSGMRHSLAGSSRSKTRLGAICP